MWRREAHLFVAEISAPGTDSASLGLQSLQASFEMTDSRRVGLLNTGVDQALQLLRVLAHVVVHHLVLQLCRTKPLRSLKAPQKLSCQLKRVPV